MVDTLLSYTFNSIFPPISHAQRDDCNNLDKSQPVYSKCLLKESKFLEWRYFYVLRKEK